MKLNHENYDQISVFTVSGDFTSDDIDLMRKTVDERLDENIKDIVLDISEMEFVDSKGLEALLWLQEHCGEQLGQVRLVGASDNVSKILEITRLASRFDSHNDVESAMKSLR